MSEPLVFLQGRVLSRDEARVSVFDAGLLHGVGLFETMIARRRGDGYGIFRLDEHLDRLAGSAAELGLSSDIRTGPLADAIRLTAERSGYEKARIRLTITGGDLNLLETSARSNITPTVIVTAQPATPYPEAMFEKGVMATLGDTRLNPLDPMSGHKTLNYWPRLRELQVAASKGAGESILLQVTNHVAAGCVSNVFVVRDGSLHTPLARGEEERGAIPSPVLPGITRQAIIDIAQQKGIGTTRRMMTIDDLLDADELFLTNSSWGVLPVVRIEAETIGSGRPGEITRALRSGLQAAEA
ncbi:MAG: branched-chain-amino-acid transaminase [Phycisphaerales bacterium]